MEEEDKGAKLRRLFKNATDVAKKREQVEREERKEQANRLLDKLGGKTSGPLLLTDWERTPKRRRKGKSDKERKAPRVRTGPWDPRQPQVFPELFPPTESEIKAWRRRAKKAGLTQSQILWLEDEARKRGEKIP